ncbi:PadR family transcriptional regulator [Subtercola endophyticus]|uniref:PadR family transcriptional regulator n=1 Tax=Subtercola endophyticus TaxID=2895559 RepID=UPI001E5301B6|nr:PadR family transcriptional regulator [Subtercola endophyticus]UFS58914.1 PadR family transcriptional regulator [Subtercola endophyticus]
MAPAALTPLSLSALALLTESPMHPYEMYQLLIKRFKNEIVKVRPGSLYHAVDRLARDGFAAVVGTGRDGSRPEKTTYEITPAGRAALEARVSELLETPANEYPEFELAISEAHNLPRATVIQLLSVRLTRLREQLSVVRDLISQKSAQGALKLFYLHGSHREALLTTEIAWIEQLVADLTSHDIVWLDDPDFDRAEHVAAEAHAEYSLASAPTP